MLHDMKAWAAFHIGNDLKIELLVESNRGMVFGADQEQEPVGRRRSIPVDLMSRVEQMIHDLVRVPPGLVRWLTVKLLVNSHHGDVNRFVYLPSGGGQRQRIGPIDP